MATYQGYNGVVKVNTSTTVGEVTNFSLTISTDVKETSKLGSAWATNVPTLSRWSGSLNANFDPDDAGQVLLSSGDVVTLELNAGNGRKYSGSAVIGDNGVTNDVGGIVAATFSFTGSGELTLTEVA